MNEAEETIKRIAGHKGVIGVIIVNADGIPIKTNMDNSATNQYATCFHLMIQKARSIIRDIEPNNDLTFLRVRSKKNEILVAPAKDFLLIVIQSPNE